MLVKYISKKAIMALFAIAAIAVLSAAVLISQPVSAASSNDIIYGGVDSVAELKQKFNNGDSKHSAANIQRIFKQAIGVTSASQFNGMVTGYIYRNGEVKVNGEVVATGAQSTGRSNFRNSKPLGNTGAYYESTSVRFSQGTNRVRALVKVVNGQFKFAVQTSCGNPTWATPTTNPEFECEDLSADITNGKLPLRVGFTARADVQDTTVTGYLWDFDGDGDVDRTTSDNQTSYTYRDIGTYHATVRIKTTVGTESNVQRACKVKIVVKEQPPAPEFMCESLVIDNGDDDTVAPRRIDFEGTASVTDTEVTGYTYVVLDENGNEVEREKIETDALSVEFSYLFDQPGEYSVYLLVHTADGDTERVSDCEVQIVADEQPLEPTPEPQPEPEPEPEPELPKTGVFTATAGVAGTTGLWVGARKWLQSRRKLLQNLMNK